ncbi:unnamed protein product [Cladocopium goreaui]|uniref:Uncharacterized protein n=1 Tax=Cladocopium goreaui TaxID=2562237 RepID=A0A9P1G6G2_9DINO|nr:unnamed protein product [Cladocopium goreaui]
MQKEGKTMQHHICNLSFPSAADCIDHMLAKVHINGFNGNAADLLKPVTFSNGQHGSSCIFHWSFAPSSLWSGEAEAWKLASLCKSIFHKGYDKTEFMLARDLERCEAGLRFADGQKRGLACRLATLGLKL